MPVKPWQEIRDAKKAEQASRIPAAWKIRSEDFPPDGTVDLRPVAASSGILSTRELKITGEEYDATSLAVAIAEGTYSAEEVATAFCKRAAIGHQLCNTLTEIMFQDAIEDAKRLDAYFRKTGKTIGPLHGLPMTFKECFHVSGYDACNGYISRAFNPSTTTTYIIELVKAAGAVVISKTNVPQTMLVCETDNNVFGRTKNSVVSHLTSGGSSGGEGSNMAFRGSAIGIGTDVAGSIRLRSHEIAKIPGARIPAAANGIYGFKPTSGVLPFIGYAASGYTGVNSGIPATLGPIANSARDLALLVRVVRDAKPWLVDPAVIPNICEQGTSTRKPIIGVISQSGLTPHPPVQRAIKEAAAKLQGAGFEVKNFTPPNFAEIRIVTQQLLTLDSLSYQKCELSNGGEPVVPSVHNFGFWDIPGKTQEETWAWNTKRLAFCKAMLDRWQEAKVDVVICPAGPYAAVLPGGWNHDLYTVTWNAMDYPAAIIPFTKADPKLDPRDSSFAPLNSADATNEATYDPQLMAGAPVALQIVGCKYGDEQLLKDVETIDMVLNTSVL
ncbi:Acetamidase [Lachnellula subtilissima]|uniref:Acetamidase n=1 Tax=Lachnellula subtilissima TaxID=602034 RepID=A0A8H8RSQ7_9HELO|nr:Acetamidase [Lachnellula subtilissima]